MTRRLTMQENADRLLRRILAEVLALKPEQAERFTAGTGLFGHLPELDSMAVGGLLTEIEDRFHIVIEDDELDGDLLETYGALLDFVETRLRARQEAR